jgi:hypothetical protein
MPPRWLTVAIVAFWLGMNGWLFWRDLWPDWQPGQPPAYEVGPLDEVQKEQRPWTVWSVLQDGHKVFRGETRIRHPAGQRGVYELEARFAPGGATRPARLSGCRLTGLASTYRVKDGDLLAVDVKFDVVPEAAVFLDLRQRDLTLHIHGEVQGRRFAPRLDAELPGVLKKSFALPEVEVSRHGTVMMPLHPVERVRGLSPGQRWRVPVFDPVLDSLSALAAGGGGPRVLDARVLERPELFSWGKRQDEECLVIEYTGEETEARTWVSRRNDQVLCQEATLSGSRWAMNRE